MRIGIPNGLLLLKYRIFAEAFFRELGIKTVLSPETNKDIMDKGVKYSVDDVCLPVKIFHGHVFWLVDKSDYIFVPKIMHIEQRKCICPYFCGIPEMIKSSVPGQIKLLSETIRSVDETNMAEWSVKTAKTLGIKKETALRAYSAAVKEQNGAQFGYNDTEYKFRIALVGHIYNIHDRFVNMNLIKKLHELGIGVVTTEYADKSKINEEVASLIKQPFWYFAAEYYGAALSLYKSGKVQGIIYVSAFSCGVDSVVIELIRNSLDEFPLLVLKIDEHTGEAGFDTRLEAFADMLKRRITIGNNSSKNGEYMRCGQGAV